MHLTRLTLDPRSAQARRDLADPYDMHRTLVRAFVTDASEVPPRFLWRFEASQDWSEPVLLVQASHAADWSPLEALTGYLKKPVESKPLALERLLQADARYRFRLVANPTVTRDGKRYGLATEEAQQAWLDRQGQRCGFHVDAACVAASDVLHSRKGNARISLQRVTYEGVLRVHDATAMAAAQTAGIGPGKAFGCGLLSLGRLSS